MIQLLVRCMLTKLPNRKVQDFKNFWSALQSSEPVKGASDETDVVKWTFKDGTVLEVKQEEHSVCLPVHQGINGC